jgi:methyl-accepting chemotaxis protein
MAGKGLAVGRTHGNGNGAAHAANGRGVASEFDRSMKKASYVDDTPVPVIVMDCEHTIEYVNSAAAMFAGKAQQMCAGLKLWDLFEVEASRNGTGLASRAIRDGRTVSGDIECTVQGRTVAVRATASPRYDEDHKIIGVVEVIADNSQEMSLSQELLRLVKAARDGHFKVRGDADQFQGMAQNLIGEVNDMLDANLDKLNWFQAILDAVPLPIHVMDKHMNWVFMNLAFEKLMKDAGVINERHESVGKPCSLSAKSGCKTPNCGVVQLSKGVAESFFDWKGENCKQNTAKLFNVKNEHIGYVEIAQDLTPLVRSQEYTSGEVDRLAGNLLNLAQGNFDFDLQVKEADQYTTEARDHFDRISQILATVKLAVEAMVGDAAKLGKSAAEGHFEVRADAARHSGEYREIVQSVNQTLDVVVDKLNWYQAIIDAVQLPIHVIDKDMKWVFLNKAFEKLMVANGIVRSRADAPGMPCSSAGANICKTENCGIAQLSKGVGETYFDWCGQNCRQESSKLVNIKGEHVGYVEVVQDLTSIVRNKDYTANEVTRVAANLVKLAEGNFDLDLELKEPDKYTAESHQQFGKINDNLAAVKSAVAAVVQDASMLTMAAVAGTLKTRADASKHQGEFRNIVQGVNETLDAVIEPLNVAASYVDRISKGDIPEKITANYNGDFNIIKVNLNQCINEMGALREATAVTERMAENDYSKGVDGKYVGIYAELAVGINGAQDRVRHLTDTVKNISHGNLEDLAEYQKVGSRSENDELMPSFIALMTNLRTLVDDAGMLTKAAVEGKLATRADAAKHEGDFRKIVQGVNDTLDAVIGPLNFSAGYVDRISKGDIPPKITDSYNGDFNTIKLNLNQCIDAVNGMIADAAMLTKAAVEGKLETRADASKHQGDYRKIVQGVNDTLDAVIAPLKFSADYVDRISKGDMPAKITDNYNGDFNTIKVNLNQCIDAVNGMMSDAAMLTKAAVEGKLETRADAAKHQGDFRKIVQGVNDTLDAVVKPIQDVSEVLTKLASGDFTATVTTKYAGDFELLADAVNLLSTTVRSALEQIGRNVASLASSAEELNKVSQSMGSNADETATQANVVSAAAEQVSNNVQTVATGADEMSASIKEIAKSTAEASRVATSAVRTAEATNVTISKLGQSSAEIGQVIKVITSIAQQTNLLALNATIEAARAGEAGKGFAVVANEVKELAKETAKATEDISRKIEAIQGDTNGAVSAIGQISQVIGQISDIQNTIASAIEEQSATTNEIGRTLAEAAKGSTDISKNIGGVAEAARATTVGATDTSNSAHTLEKMAAELQTLVSQFRY